MFEILRIRGDTQCVKAKRERDSTDDLVKWRVIGAQGGWVHKHTEDAYMNDTFTDGDIEPKGTKFKFVMASQ